MQRYDPATSIYPFDGHRKDLAREFQDNMKGPHSEELRRILYRMRTTPLCGRYAVIVVEPFRRWKLARLSGVRGEPPKIIDSVSFESLAQAEWGIFKRRWQDLSGVSIEF